MFARACGCWGVFEVQKRVGSFGDGIKVRGKIEVAKVENKRGCEKGGNNKQVRAGSL